VYPGTDSESVLYEDDGMSLDYLRDRAVWTRIHWNEDQQALILEPDSRSKMNPIPPRKFEVIVVSKEGSKTVDYVGQRAQVAF